jgi:hypothetical protein
MKLKITVELEEGIKCTVERRMTTEAVLLKLRPEPGTDVVNLDKLKDELLDQATAGAGRAIKGILRFLEKNPLVLQVTEGDTIVSHKVTDINEAYAWLSKHKKPAQVPCIAAHDIPVPCETKETGTCTECSGCIDKINKEE